MFSPVRIANVGHNHGHSCLSDKYHKFRGCSHSATAIVIAAYVTNILHCSLWECLHGATVTTISSQNWMHGYQSEYSQEKLFCRSRCRTNAPSARLITIPKRSCGKVMFSQACVKNSVHRGVHPLGRQPPGQTPPLGRHPLPRQTATAANGTHPTGMHSCFYF